MEETLGLKPFFKEKCVSEHYADAVVPISQVADDDRICIKNLRKKSYYPIFFCNKLFEFVVYFYTSEISSWIDFVTILHSFIVVEQVKVELLEVETVTLIQPQFNKNFAN